LQTNTYVSFVIFAKGNTAMLSGWSFYHGGLPVCLCIYLPDDDLVDVETCRRVVSDIMYYWLCSLLDSVPHDQSIAWNMDFITFKDSVSATQQIHYFLYFPNLCCYPYC